MYVIKLKKLSSPPSAPPYCFTQRAAGELNSLDRGWVGWGGGRKELKRVRVCGTKRRVLTLLHARDGWVGGRRVQAGVP